jgi:hypothetical protein
MFDFLARVITDFTDQEKRREGRDCRSAARGGSGIVCSIPEQAVDRPNAIGIFSLSVCAVA